MPASPVNLPAYWRLLRTNRNFRLLWISQLISETGDWLYMVAIYSLLLELTGSAKIVAFAFVLQVLPQCFVAPTAGVINDRLSRKRVMIATDWFRAAIVFSMMFVQTQDMLWLLYILLFTETVFWGLYEPARGAVIPSITSSEEQLVANALSSTTWSFTLAIGSSIGGVVAAVYGRKTVFILNALSFVVSAMLVRRMQFQEPHLEGLAPMRAKDLVDFSPILEGIRYVSKNRKMLATIFVKCGIGVMGTNWVLLPIFGQKIFPITVGGFDPKSGAMLSMSLLMGCRGIGALLGPFVAAMFTGLDERKYRKGILYGFLIGAAGYLCLGNAPSLPLACAAIVLAHSGSAISWVFSTTLLQIHTDDKFRGRVFSAEFAFSMFTLSLVSYGAGVLSDAGVPVRTLAMWTGAMILVPAALWAMALRLWRDAPPETPR